MGPCRGERVKQKWGITRATVGLFNPPVGLCVPIVWSIEFQQGCLIVQHPCWTFPVVWPMAKKYSQMGLLSCCWITAS